MDMVLVCVSRDDETKVAPCQLLDSLVTNAIDFLWCQLVFRRK